MLRFIAATIAVLVISNSVLAQGGVNIVGVPSFAFNSDSAFLNFGGPNIKFELGSLFGGLSFYPSLRYNNSIDEWTPILGCGPYMGKDHLFLALPSYYYNSTWHMAIGLGYKF